MSRTIRKYQLRNKKNRYQRVDKNQLEDRYYSGVSKSHERKIKRKKLREDSQDDEYC